VSATVSTEITSSDRVWTVPNALSLARLFGVPLFLWLILIDQDWWALGVLVIAGGTDWLDGKLARMLNQTSKLGTVLDPLADRLYIFATLVGLTIRGVVPVWLAALLVLREVLLALTIPVLGRHGYGFLNVSFAGKAATANLLYAFPLLLLGDHTGTYAEVAKIIGWAFVIWGTALYWWALALYVVQVRRLVLADRTGTDPGLLTGDP
jgi:cardiolipin synthase